jgi:hypothetical protein
MKTIETYKHESRGRKIYRTDYESLGEFARDCRDANVAKKYSGASQSSWWGGDSIHALMDKCVAGEEKHIGEAEKLLEQLRDEIEIPKPHWAMSAYGAIPDVGSFLAGEIECMRHLIQDPNMSAPVRIYYDPTSSAMIDAKTLVKRGTAALALAMALAQIRPVELWTFSDLDANGKDMALICAKIQTNPLMLSEACFALCNPGFARGLTYGLAEIRMGFQGMWGFSDNDFESTRRTDKMREALRANPQDIVIPGIHAHDDLVNDPLGFIRRELAKFHEVLEEA